MKRELIIIVYKIAANGLTRQQEEQQFHDMMNRYNLSQDPELKENYIIREIWLPTDSKTDVKVIYPKQEKSQFDQLVKELNKRINDDPSNFIKGYWKKILRELKLRKLNEQS